jgi:hypothetical protein
LGVDAQLFVEEIKSEVKRVVPPLTGEGNMRCNMRQAQSESIISTTSLLGVGCLHNLT